MNWIIGTLLVLFAAVGAGFTSGCVLARWTY